MKKGVQRQDQGQRAEKTELGCLGSGVQRDAWGQDSGVGSMHTTHMDRKGSLVRAHDGAGLERRTINNTVELSS